MGRSRARTIASVAFGVILALITAQVMARRVYSVEHAFDPVLGGVFAPGSCVQYRLEGGGRSTWLAHGIRGPQQRYGDEQDPILILGDSFTEALQVDDDQTYVYKTEKRLRDLGWKGALLNHGRSSASVADYIAWANTYTDLFKQNWTVIQVREDDFTSDAWNQHKQDRSACNFLHAGDGSKIIIQKGTLVEAKHRSLLRRAIQWARDRSALLQFCIRRAEMFRTWIQTEPPLFRASQVATSARAESVSSRKEYPIQEELKLLSDAYGGRITILFLSEFNPRNPSSVSEFEKYLTGQCRSNSISFVSTSSYYGPLACRGLAPFGFSNSQYNSGHLNADGHEIVATALSKELQEVIHTHGLH